MTTGSCERMEQWRLVKEGPIPILIVMVVVLFWNVSTNEFPVLSLFGHSFVAQQAPSVVRAVNGRKGGTRCVSRNHVANIDNRKVPHPGTYCSRV